MLNGCNYFGKGTIRSAPFAIFNRQDLLQLALDLKVPVPEIYGSILKDEDGRLYTSGEQRLDARCVDLEFSSKNGLTDSIGYGNGTTKNGIFG